MHDFNFGSDFQKLREERRKDARGIFAFGLLGVLVAIVLNIGILALAVWVVVVILRAMGVIE